LGNASDSGKQKYSSLQKGNYQVNLATLIRLYKSNFPGIDVYKPEFANLSLMFGVNIRNHFDVSELRPQNNEQLMQLLLLEEVEEEEEEEETKSPEVEV
jgi:hypothetical protein